MSFKNKQGITNIRMSGTFKAYCPLGRKDYTGNVAIQVNEPSNIPDYCDVDRFVDSLNGSERIIEDAVCEIHAFIAKQVRSYELLRVSCRVDDAAHSPVTVVKESSKPVKEPKTKVMGPMWSCSSVERRYV